MQLNLPSSRQEKHTERSSKSNQALQLPHSNSSLDLTHSNKQRLYNVLYLLHDLDFLPLLTSMLLHCYHFSLPISWPCQYILHHRFFSPALLSAGMSFFYIIPWPTPLLLIFCTNFIFSRRLTHEHCTLLRTLICFNQIYVFFISQKKKNQLLL